MTTRTELQAPVEGLGGAAWQTLQAGELFGRPEGVSVGVPRGGGRAALAEMSALDHGQGCADVRRRRAWLMELTRRVSWTLDRANRSPWKYNDRVANPFTPASGSIPRVYKGRDEIFAEIDSALASSYRDHWANLLLLGSTGMGKSSLLSWAATRAGDLGWPVARLSIGGDLAQAKGLADALLRGAEGLSSQHSVVARARAAAKKIPVRPKAPWFEYVTKVESSATEAVAEATRRLERLGNDLQVPVLLLIDEAHELSEDAATALVNAIIDSEGPVLIIAAGLSSAWDTMVFDTLTPASRMFLPINVRRLSDADACSVLRETAASGGVNWPGELVASAASLANNIPAELQAIGSFLWDCGPNVSENSTQRSLTRYATSRRQMINRILSRMPREAVLVARELVSHGTRGERIPLLAVRAMTKDDDSFRSVMNILERTGLVDIDDDQIASINIELQHFAQFLAVEPSKAQESPPALEV